MQHLVASAGELHVGNLVETYQPSFRITQQQFSDTGHVIARRGSEQHHQIDYLSALVNLADGRTLIGGA